MLKEENKLYQEWISLIQEAYQLGLSIVEIKEFIYSNQKEQISKWCRIFFLPHIYYVVQSYRCNLCICNMFNLIRFKISQLKFFRLAKGEVLCKLQMVWIISLSSYCNKVSNIFLILISVTYHSFAFSLCKEMLPIKL